MTENNGNCDRGPGCPGQYPHEHVSEAIIESAYGPGPDGEHGDPLPTMSDGALNLMGQIVDANVRSLAWTTDRIAESHERQIEDLATTIVMIDNILEDALVIDRKTEERLMMLRGRMDAAHLTLERKRALS